MEHPAGIRKDIRQRRLTNLRFLSTRPGSAFNYPQVRPP
jgi:hypothetical protein